MTTAIVTALVVYCIVKDWRQVRDIIVVGGLLSFIAALPVALWYGVLGLLWAADQWGAYVRNTLGF